eukprot:s5794_g2.t1
MGVSQNLADVPGDLADVPNDLLGDLADVPNDIFGDLGGGVPDACAQSDVEANLPDVPEVSNSHGSVKEGNFEASDEEPESKLVVANTLDVATADGFDLAEPASSSAAAPSIPDGVVVPAHSIGAARPKVHHTQSALAQAAPPGCSVILNCDLALIPKSVSHT